MDTLQIQPISKAAALQRSGRAGREVFYLNAKKFSTLGKFHPSRAQKKLINICLE